MSYLDYLEDEAIFIIREAIAEFEHPVFLYSIGKDSSVLMRLILKAFAPLKPPMKFLHIDTGWKFKEMIKFRDEITAHYGVDLIVHQNKQGLADNVTPFTHGSQVYTDIMKTKALREALDLYKFDVAFGGARRDEEKSRAKERIFSFRNKFHGWDSKNQRVELFRMFNTKINNFESMRVFPLSNWTELDVWEYIKREEIEIVPLYFAAKRPIIERDGVKIMVDDNRIPLTENEKPNYEMVRFRTLGCYPLTGAIPSEATSLDEIIAEVREAKFSERQGRLIDSDQTGSMEKKKMEGYF